MCLAVIFCFVFNNDKKKKQRYCTPENCKHKKSLAPNYGNIVPTSQSQTEGIVVDDEITFQKQTYQQDLRSVPIISPNENSVQNENVEGPAK